MQGGGVPAFRAHKSQYDTTRTIAKRVIQETFDGARVKMVKVDGADDTFELTLLPKVRFQ